VRSSVWTTALFGCLISFLVPAAVLSQNTPAANPALDIYRRAVLAQKGDSSRGQKLYENTQRSQCKKCHAIEGVGSIVGPDLLGVGSRYDRASLLDTIIEPSAKIHPDYAATIIVTKGGKIHTGITRQINEKDLEIVASETEKVRVPLDEVAERKSSPVSAMPSGLHEKIAPAEMADLLTYLSQLKPSRTGSRQEALDAREIPRSVDYLKFHSIIDQSLAFQRPVWFGPIPGRPGAQLVLEIDQAKIWLLEGEGASARKSLFIDISAETTGGEFTGLMSLAFHPDFLKNRRYFLKLHAIPPEGKPKIRENALQVNIIERKFSADFQSDSGEPSKTIIKIPCFTVFHHGGDLAFGPDGFLYSTMGDTGPQGDPDGHAQDMSVLNGKMFRIDVDRTEGDLPYAIPPDNPFRNQTGARPEIWALGFREIWRHCFDPVTGDLYAAEVGQNRFEEIIIVRRGENYGWNVMEGFIPYSEAYRSKEAKYAPPLFAYGHSIGPSVTGGFVYRGKKHPSLVGKYIFGDYETRRVWALEQRDRRLLSVVEIGRAPDKFGAFGLDAEGELYLVGLDYGMIYRLEPRNADLSPSTAREIVRTAREAGET
jgi:putative heme-binding domain-containing protein